MIDSTTFGAKPSDGSSSKSRRGSRHERAAEREHLLLAAGERSGALALALREAWKKSEDFFQLSVFLLLRARGKGAQLEILPDGHRGKEPSAFRHQRDAMLDDPLRRGFADSFILPSNRARARREQAGNSFEQSSFSGAVGTNERDHLARLYDQAHALESE